MSAIMMGLMLRSKYMQENSMKSMKLLWSLFLCPPLLINQLSLSIIKLGTMSDLSYNAHNDLWKECMGWI
ncbi:MAG: hypothetical protein A2Z02_01750 [Chloroflexi bacterium RBG_16_48_7]|nr:MAG: hypothetical protein A2Z02_01750 [Chloroflexi bacterium RBG_16_48_7]